MFAQVIGGNYPQIKDGSGKDVVSKKVARLPNPIVLFESHERLGDLKVGEEVLVSAHSELLCAKNIIIQFYFKFYVIFSCKSQVRLCSNIVLNAILF